jgi:hypothetical protein
MPSPTPSLFPKRLFPQMHLSSGNARLFDLIVNCTIRHEKEAHVLLSNPSAHEIDPFHICGRDWWGFLLQQDFFTPRIWDSCRLFQRRHERAVRVLSRLPKPDSFLSCVREIRHLPPLGTLDTMVEWVRLSGGFDDCPIPFAHSFAPIFLYVHHAHMRADLKSSPPVSAIHALTQMGQDWSLLPRLMSKSTSFHTFVSECDAFDRSRLSIGLPSSPRTGTRHAL